MHQSKNIGEIYLGNNMFHVKLCKSERHETSVIFYNKAFSVSLKKKRFLQIFGMLWKLQWQLQWLREHENMHGAVRLNTEDGEERNIDICIDEENVVRITTGSISIKLSLDEYFSFVKNLISLADSVVDVEGFHVKYFTPDFFSLISAFITDLECVVFDEIYLEDMYDTAEELDTQSEEIRVIYKPLRETRILKCLHGDTQEVSRHTQSNLPYQTNVDRVFRMKKEIEKGYPFDDKYIVFFNDSNAILDGLHRASCLYYLYGNIKIKVIRLFFYGNKYNVKMHCLNREPEINFFMKYEHVYIFGAGKYGKILVKKFSDFGLVVDGFVVTSRGDVDSIHRMPVLEIHDIPYSPNNCGIVLGLRSIHHTEVKLLLNSAGFYNLYEYDDCEIEGMGGCYC